MTIDETWIHHFTPDSAEWTKKDETHPKQPKMQTYADKFLASVFCNAQGILLLKKEITKKMATNEEKKCSFIKTMHRVTSWSQWWQNYKNCNLNCFHTHPGLQIWPPATTGCLQTSKECFSERDLVPIKKWCWKTKDKLFYKKGIRLLGKHWNQCITQEGDYVDE